MALIAALFATAAIAGNVCTWTGGGGDGKFSTASNWSVAPVSGNGDLLYFPVGTASEVSELTAENDLEGLSVAAIRTHGHNNSVLTLNGNGITLTGAAAAVCPEIPATTVISNYTALVVNTPLTVTRAGGNAYMRFYGQKLTVNAKITATDVEKLYLYGRLKFAYAAYIGEVERYPSQSLGSYFNAPIEAPDTVLHACIGQNCGAQEVYFNGKITTKEIWFGTGTRDTQPHLTAAGNAIGKIRFVADNVYLDVAEALDANTVICDYRDDWMWGGHYYVKSGTHQTINRIEGNGAYLANYPEHYNLRTSTSGGAAEVEMRGSADASTGMRVRDQVSLVWNPTGNFKQTFKDRVHDTKGEITVKGGTFAVAGTNAFTSVPLVSVLAGAKLEISSTNAVRPAFGSLKTLLLGNGAACVVAAGANPFPASTTIALLGTGAKFTVAAGVDVKLADLAVAGVRIADGTYTAGAANPWLEGAGSVTVASAGATGVTYWMSSVSGDWDTAANWSHGVPGASSEAMILGNGSLTVRLSESSVLPAKLSVRNVDGVTTVLLPEGERAWKPTELTLGAGGRFEVPTGAKVVSDDMSGTVQVNGGELLVSGGEMVYTNFNGSFTVQGTSATTGRVFVANGRFVYAMKTENKDSQRLLLNTYGELYATNGIVETLVIHYPFLQKGGRIVFAGNAELRNDVSKSVEWYFGAGETIFEDDAVLRVRNSLARFNLTSYETGITAKMVFRGNACFIGNTEDPTIGSPSGAHSILEFDSAKPNLNTLGIRCNVGCGKTSGEMIVKRGYVCTGYRGLNVGGSTGHRWNPASTETGARGVLRMEGGAMNLLPSYGGSVTEGTFAGFQLGDGGPAKVAHDLKGAFTGLAEVSGGVITNNGSTVVGGARGIGTYVQTGGTFLHTYGSAAFITGCAGGTGTLTLGGGRIDVGGDVFVGGALTNQIYNGYVLDQFYNGNYPTDRHDAVGTLTVTGGTFRSAKNLYVGCDGTGTVAVAGTPDFTVGGNLVLSNTTVAAAGEVPGWTTAAKLAFALDATAGIEPLKVTGKVVNTEGTTVRVDLGAYKGKKSRIPLITASSFEGAAFDSVEIVGDDASCARVMQTAKALNLLLQHGTMLIVR